MILRLTPAQLHKLADQIDALAAMERAGADHLEPNTVVKLDGVALGYAHWHEDDEAYLLEIISFTPGDAPPLAYHDARKLGT